MNHAQKVLTRYVCHKQVNAGKIRRIVSELVNDEIVHRLNIEGTDISIEVTPIYMDKHKPYPGGYYIIYKDGYESFSPADAFEEGYLPLSEIERIREKEHTPNVQHIKQYPATPEGSYIKRELEAREESSNPHANVSSNSFDESVMENYHNPKEYPLTPEGSYRLHEDVKRQERINKVLTAAKETGSVSVNLSTFNEVAQYLVDVHKRTGKHDFAFVNTPGQEYTIKYIHHVNKLFKNHLKT